MINKTLLKDEAEKIGIYLDSIALDRLDIYAEMLVETNKTLNLTAITDPNEILYKHFLDSLSLLTCIDIHQGAKIIDRSSAAAGAWIHLAVG